MGGHPFHRSSLYQEIGLFTSNILGFKQNTGYKLIYWAHLGIWRLRLHESLHGLLNWSIDPCIYRETAVYHYDFVVITSAEKSFHTMGPFYFWKMPECLQLFTTSLLLLHPTLHKCNVFHVQWTISTNRI